MKKTIAIFGLLLASSSMFSQSGPEESKVEIASSSNSNTLHKIGLHSGYTSGVGLSYKIQFAEKHQFQLVTLPIASSSSQWINTGLQYRYKFRDYGNWDLLTYAAFSYTFDRNEDSWGIIGPDQVGFTITHDYRSSVGLAFEYGKTENVKLNFQTGYGVIDITNRWRTTLTAAVGIEFLLNQ